jgi:ferredoxin-NADP reductase
VVDAGELLLILVGALLLQVGGFALFGLLRRRRSFADNGDGARPMEALADSPSVEKVGGSSAGWPGFRDFVVERKVHESADHAICSFYLKPLDGKPLPHFLPGQFLTFRLDLPSQDGTGTKPLVRCYSLSDAPGRDYYRVSIKRVAAPPDQPQLPPGRGSGHFHDQVDVGSRLAVRAPAGQFFLQQADRLPVVLIAGGIGLTPMLSMLGVLLEGDGKREVTLFYGVRNGDELAMGEQLRRWARSHDQFHLHLCFSAPGEAERPGQDYDHAGRIDLPLLRNTLPLRPHQFYLCGPPSMMKSLVAGLEEWGVEAQQIHYESFGPASLTPAPQRSLVDSTAPAPLITFSGTGKTIPWDPAAGSLLEFAETNGIEVASGCRSGSCGGCQTALSAGKVEYHHPPDVEPEPGHCLLCISSPTGAITLEA